MTQDLREDVVIQLPHLRAFARLLARDRALADDLVQETVVRALSHAHQFQPGTNFKAWVTTILRNTYFSELRRRAKTTALDPAVRGHDRSISGGQDERLHMRDFERVFHSLSPAQREALLLVGASGFSYEEAAEVVKCAVGTMKSRVSRARIQLQERLDGTEAPPVAPARPSPRRSIQTGGRPVFHGEGAAAGLI